MKKRHLKSLTSIRFLAAFHVVLYHQAIFLDPLVPDSLSFLRNYLHTGYVGVNLFFVLSGFILAYTYLEPDRLPSVERRKFWVARIARIYPLYLVAMILVAPFVIVHFLSTNPLGRGATKIGTSGLAALLLGQAWVPQLRSVWNPPGWTLSVETFYYLCFPAAAAILWRLSRRRAKVALVGVWLLGLVPPLTAWLLLPPSLTHTGAAGVLPKDDLLILLTSAPILRLPEFLFGILLARAYLPHHGALHGEIGPRRSALLVTIGAASLLLALGLADRIPRLFVEPGLLDPLFGILIVGLPGLRGPLQRLLSSGCAVILGEASYAIYILQAPLSYWLQRALPSGMPQRMGPGYFVLFATLVVLVAIAAFRWIEDPARRWVRGRFAQPTAQAREVANPTT